MVELLKPTKGNQRTLTDRWEDGTRKAYAILRSLPFYESEGGGYVHRVRSGMHHCWEGNKWAPHTSVAFWCGSHGFIGDKRSRGRRPARLVDAPSPGRIICATCEGRAIGAGQLGSRLIAGREVVFRPHGHNHVALPETPR